MAFVDPHNSGFGAALSELSRVAESAAARVFLRYRPARSAGAAVPLQGFGASLTLKSSEYKTIDDRKAAAEEEEADTENEEGVDELADNAPSWLLRKKASEPTRRLPGGGGRELSMQASLAVLRAREPLATLRDVSSSLPSLARHLSRIKPDSATHKARADALRRHWPIVQSARGALTLNGVPLDLGGEVRRRALTGSAKRIYLGCTN